jgi:hypothetical protein
VFCMFYGLTVLLTLCHAIFGSRKNELATPSAGMLKSLFRSVSLCSTSNRKTLLSECSPHYMHFNTGDKLTIIFFSFSFQDTSFIMESTHLSSWNAQSVPKRQLLIFRRRGNTQKKIYHI